MGRFVLRLRDALSLSFTKIKTRKIRTLLTLITASIMSFVLVVASSTLTGFMKLANGTEIAELRDLHLASSDFEWTWTKKHQPEIAAQRQNNNGIVGEIPPPDKTQTQQPQNSSVADDIKMFRDVEAKTKGLKDIYVSVAGDPNGKEFATMDLAQPQIRNHEPEWSFNNQTVELKSEKLLKPFLHANQTLSWNKGEPIPVFVSNEVLVNSKIGSNISSAKSVKQRVSRLHEAQNKLVGKTTTLNVSKYDEPSPSALESEYGPNRQIPPPIPDNTTPSQATPKASNVMNIPVRVVGFLSSSSFDYSYRSSRGFALPLELAQQDSNIAAHFNKISQYLPSFDSAAHRNEYVKNNEASIYSDPVEENKEIFSALERALGIATIVMLILMAIPMAATLSKILSDSQRETGVFRAIGARNTNIITIYGLYGLLIVTAAFVLSVIFGLFVCMLLNIYFGDDIDTSVAGFTDSVVRVNLVRVNVKHFATIFAGLLGGSVLGGLFPIWRALHRDPIKALRDE